VKSSLARTIITDLHLWAPVAVLLFGIVLLVFLR
jgi:hypothetical protein